MHTPTHICSHIYMCMYVYMCISMCVCVIYTYVNMYVYIYILYLIRHYWIKKVMFAFHGYTLFEGIATFIIIFR